MLSLAVVSLPSWLQHLVHEIVLLQLDSGTQLGFSIKNYELVKFPSSREGGDLFFPLTG